MMHDGRSDRPISIEQVLARDDLDATRRFFSAARRDPGDGQSAAARELRGDTPVVDLPRYRAARMRRRLLALLHTLRLAVDHRDLQGVWDVLDEVDASRCFPPGVRDEAVEIATLPHTAHRVPIRLLHYEHTLIMLGDEPMDAPCDTTQLAIPLGGPEAERRRG